MTGYKKLKSKSLRWIESKLKYYYSLKKGIEKDIEFFEKIKYDDFIKSYILRENEFLDKK